MRAMTSLPVPVSPVIRTDALCQATVCAIFRTASIAGSRAITSSSRSVHGFGIVFIPRPFVPNRFACFRPSLRIGSISDFLEVDCASSAQAEVHLVPDWLTCLFASLPNWRQQRGYDSRRYGSTSALQTGGIPQKREVLSMKRWLVLSFAILLPVMVLGQAAKLAPELNQSSGGQMVSVIVQYNSVPGKVHQARVQA